MSPSPSSNVTILPPSIPGGGGDLSCLVCRSSSSASSASFGLPSCALRGGWMGRFWFALFLVVVLVVWSVKVFSSPPLLPGVRGGTPREEKRGIAFTASYGARSHYPPVALIIPIIGERFPYYYVWRTQPFEFVRRQERSVVVFVET